MSKESRFSILVVDDDRVLLQMAEELLRGEYAVSVAASGRQAVQLLRKGIFPDLILLDVDMPEMDGYAAIEAIKEIPLARDIPVIFLTGMTGSEDELKGLLSGAVDYITKPFVREILLARLRIHLDNAHKRREQGEDREALIVHSERYREFARMLTPTEEKVARMIVMGYTNQEIGDALHYSYNYVKKVAALIFEKAGINKRHQLRQLLIDK